MEQEHKKSFRIAPQFVLGLLIIIVGVLMVLDNLDIIYVRDFWDYWPALLIVYGIVKLTQPESQSGRFWGIAFVLVGTALLLDRLYLFNFRLWDFWPLLLVALGASMIWRKSAWRMNISVSSGTPSPRREPGSDYESFISTSAILGGSRRVVHTLDFRGGDLTAVMGGCDIDLRNAAITNSPAVLEVFAMWGGIEIKVPINWTVTFEGTPILGGYDDKTFHEKADVNQRLIVRGTVIMGGVEVRN
ncbi:MAG: hypothetical protein HY961_18180 [Ignavibacteriae bacterium]|nr:hypothetical protein [Ignavibacteriota bacterium]